MQKLAGKTAIVTGAGRGIGNAVARRFASEGARVILISRSPSSCGGAAEEINKEFPDSCKAYPCDVADYAAVQETMAAILKDFLQIDILVNNAGITRDSLMLRMKEEDWDAVLDTNLKSAFNTVKALQRVLMKSPAGRIINMSSVIGLVGNIGQANYAASKAGLIGFTKSMESIPNGFIQMISPILILTFAWTLCGLTRYGMYSANFVVNAMAGAGDLAKFLPAVIFIIGAAIGFATGTSWGTIGIMAPIVVQVFDYNTQPILCTIGLAAACSGGVMGDHCSPISDTTIMASAGAHCYHLNHVFTQIPYALTVAGVAFVSFILAGLIQNVVICLIIACVLMVATLLVIKAIVSKKHAGIFQEMAEANKVLANQQ